jgi:Tol biopolymer transport system component
MTPDPAGRQIGAYQLHALLGAGGMGEVYRARDMKLGRDVAVKILPNVFTTDPQRLARFQREARLLASLNHPHIAAIYGLEDTDAVHALVLELVEGETLADRIRRGPLPLAEALTIGRQIALALDAAHAKGIVHRDLKPANIKITPEGVVKVLDFGLAKAATTETVSADLTHSPTTTFGGTRDGMLLGTAAYMSPEQARGKPVDKRTDIWALGCVLYEMLTGHGTFARETMTDTLAAVVEREPEWNALPPATPAAIVRLLHRCLEKDATRRLHDVADVRIEIDDALWGSDRSRRVESPPDRRHRQVAFGSVIAVTIVVAAILALAAFYFTRAPRDAGAATRLSISAPGVLTPQTSVAVSPDGRRVAFVSTDASGRSVLWVRELDSLEPRSLTGTEDAAHPFWSPDGQSLAFQAGGKLKRADLSGGGVLTLVDATLRSGGSWSREGVILFTPRLGELATISAAGGPVTTVLKGSDYLAWPFFFPDGRHFLFFRGGGPPGRPSENRGVYLGSIDSNQTTRLVESDFKGAFAEPGYLLFVRGETLMAQPFDANRFQLSGEPAVVAEGLWVAAGAGQASFSVSRTGVLAYVNSTLFNLQLTWVDRNGRSLGSLGLPDRYGIQPQISPDGSRVAIARGPMGSNNIWVLKLADGTDSRLTFGPGPDVQPIWSADGKRIIFQTTAGGGPPRLFLRDAAGTGSEEPVGVMTGNAHLWDWSRDERFIVYSTIGPKGGADLWALPLAGNRKPFPFAESAFHKTQAQVSPNGRWIAYTSYESGKDEVYVQSFPLPGNQRQVSPAGGMQPRWRQDSSELFYVRSDRYIMATPVKTEGAFEAGPPAPLFRSRVIPQGSQSIWFDTAYDVTPDGQRFLFTGPPEDPRPPMTVVLNWPATLKK